MKLSTLMAHSAAMYQCAAAGLTNTASENKAISNIHERVPYSYGPHIQQEKRIRNAITQELTVLPMVAGTISAAISCAFSNFAASPFGLQAALSNPRAAIDTIKSLAVSSAAGVAVEAMLSDVGNDIDHMEHIFHAGYSAIIGCDVMRSIASQVGVNAQVACIGGRLTGAFLMNIVQKNLSGDGVKFGLANLALSGAYFYFLLLKKSRIEESLARMMEISDPFLRNAIEPMPHFDTSVWRHTCQILSQEIDKNPGFSQEQKLTLSNIVDALRVLKNSNQHLQIPLSDEQNNYRDLNENEYMLIANLLGSQLRAMRDGDDVYE